MQEQKNHIDIRERAVAYCRYEHEAQFRQEVESLLAEDNVEELFDRFYAHLSFGTGGLRGIIGGGYNRMNFFVVRRVSEGLARYLCRAQEGRLSAVISYDSRRFSRDFAEQAAAVFAAHGIHVYFFPSLRPTPELAFAIRRLSANCGIMITASHNPPNYNGYKVYWNDGSQIIPPHDQGILDEINSITEAMTAPDFSTVLQQGKVEYLDDETDDAFIAASRSVSICPELFEQENIRLAYTALHGTGSVIMEKLFADSNVELCIVPEQKEPDGEFPTVSSPNPEEATAMKMVLEYASKQGADLVLATDPDSDRLGLAISEAGGYRLLSGNQHGVLLVDYIFHRLAEQSKLPNNAVFANTIVTTDMQQRVLRDLSVSCRQTLTGFKNIADVMRELDHSGNLSDFIMGTEESYGYLIGCHVWDKDAFAAALLTVEMALFYRSKGQSILERLEELYRKHGYFEEETFSFYFAGEKGMQQMRGLMEGLRKVPAERLAGFHVQRILDVQHDVYILPSENKKLAGPGLPFSDVLRYEFNDGNWLAIRPSGTEPKLKVYISASREDDSQQSREEIRKQVIALRRELEKYVKDSIE